MKNKHRSRLFVLLFAVVCLTACGDVTVAPQPGKVYSPESKWDTAHYDNFTYHFN